MSYLVIKFLHEAIKAFSGKICLQRHFITFWPQW